LLGTKGYVVVAAATYGHDPSITQIEQPHILDVLIFKGNEKTPIFTVGQHLTTDHGCHEASVI
jgi:hypothetical protein